MADAGTASTVVQVKEVLGPLEQARGGEQLFFELRNLKDERGVFLFVEKYWYEHQVEILVRERLNTLNLQWFGPLDLCPLP